LLQDVLAQKPALLMDCEEMFDELQRRVSMFAKAIVENKMWKIGAVNVSGLSSNQSVHRARKKTLLQHNR
jgi:NADH:ubiquinone oxidoreductase subunit D